MGIENTEKPNLSEDITALFSGEDLSEDFKEKAKSIFEAAVLTKVEEQKAALEESMQTQLEEQTLQFAEGLVSKVDNYLEYVVTEWMEENRLAVEKGIKAEMVEDFMVGLKNLFMEHYIDIPEEKVEVVEELTVKYDELQSELDKAITENVEMKSQLVQYRKMAIASEIAEGLSEVQEAKLNSLAENVEFISEEDYREKILLVKRKYFDVVEDRNDIEKRKDVDSSNESLDEQYSPTMSHYVQSISRTLKK